MAPTRRKGTSRAAATIAAAKKFKVGDLVLAKVKGFPAWPAKVSVPEEWGFPSDPRKVHVFFFGTQQIAFCSPADVEAFTEEKKQSLLNRRHGKGLEFVRAVREIVDSYEKLKNKDLVNGMNSNEEITLTNHKNCIESPAEHDSRQAVKTLADSPDSQLNASTSSNKNESNLRNIDTSLVNSLHGEDPSAEEPDNNVIAKVMPSIATYSSRKRSSGPRGRRLVAPEVVTSRDRSRSSSRLESRRLLTKLKATNSGGSSEDMMSDSSHDGLRLRSRRIRKSTITFEGDDTQSLSNGTTKVNGSEIAAMDSDSSSLSERNKMGPGCEPEQSETVDCFRGDTELSKGLDLHMKATVQKKKRKPSRKRATSIAAEPAVYFYRLENSEVGLHEVTSSVSSCIKRDVRDSKEDGDEHLPLLKRARVRMGKQFSSEERIHSSIPMEEKTKEIKVNMEQKHSLSQNDGCFRAEGCSSVLETASDELSKETPNMLNNRAQFWQLKSNQSVGCSLNEEATLPPSKRLHRALEAMSANTSEEERFCTEASLTLKANISESSIPSMPQSPEKAMTSEEGTAADLKSDDTSEEDCFFRESLTLRTKVSESYILSMPQSPNKALTTAEGTGSGLRSDNSPRNRVSQVGGPESSTSPSQLISQENNKPFVELTIDNQLDNNSKSQKNEVLWDRPGDRIDCIDSRTLSEPCSGRLNAEAPAHNSRHLSPHFDQALNCCNVVSPKIMLPSKDEYQIEVNVLGGSGHKQVNKEHSVSEESALSSISVPMLEKAGPAQSGTTVSCYKAGAICEKKVSLKSQVDESSRINSMHDIVDEHNSNERRMPTNSLSISNGDAEDKKTKCVPLILSPAGEVVSPLHISPSSATLYHISTSESVADEGKVDSAVTQRLTLGKPNYVEAQAALSSFEAVLGTLTRTKESIGRATRMAMDCAKFGTAAKVIEILMCHLENELNSHRRVDMFFLVDSIAQCSRSLKGNVGGAFPSAIQGALPRLLSATAPPGSEGQENRRQCIKVLRLWSERRILPESIVRQHIRELDSVAGLAAVYSRRSLRTERALDDPVRDMGSMLVDEYGSNSSFQLPGLSMPCMLKVEDGGSDSDGGSFEAVTPEHKSDMPEGQDMMPLTEKRGHILEDVDGELEMEDVAPSCGDSAQLEKVQASDNHPEQILSQHSSRPLPPKVVSSLPPPLLPPETTAPTQLPSVSAATDCCHDKDLRGNFRQSVSQTSFARHSHSFSNFGQHHTPEFNRESRIRIQPPASSSSLNDLHSRPGNNVERGANFQSKAQPPRPPHPSSSQYSYTHAEQHVKSRRETPRHCYSNRFHNSHLNRGNYYNNHERTKPGPYDHRGGWRAPAPSFPGPRYPDKKASYGHNPFMDHPGEPMGIINDGWNMPPRPWNQRNSAPYRPHPENSFPVSSRGPGFWRPR